MYSGVNDENNQGAFNDENSLYHYSYSKDREPQPGQPDPSQTSWQPASRPEDPVSPEEPVAYTTGACQDDPQPPKPEKGSFWKKTGTKVTALVLCCALIGGLCGFGGASLARRGGKATIQESGRTASAVSVKSVDGQTLMTPAEVYASTVNSVVSINCSAVSTNIFGQKVESASSGSGFVITQDGYIVTNQHVVSGASSVNVTLYNGDTYPATVVGGDSDYDVAVLKIEATGLQAVTLGKSADVNVGDTVMAIGNPLGELREPCHQRGGYSLQYDSGRRLHQPRQLRRPPDEPVRRGSGHCVRQVFQLFQHHGGGHRLCHPHQRCPDHHHRHHGKRPGHR